MLKVSLVAATTILSTCVAFAQGVVIERTTPAVPATRSTTTIEKHGVDCDTRTVHKENDLGESKTVSRTDCD